jgi:deazaflavin-dependent oxidoreductase (nitroreductase family)
MNDQVITEFRENGGKVGGYFAGMELLLLTNKGAKSGAERINPLAYTMDGDNYIIIASKGGADTHPDWYYNLIANPDVTVEVGTDKFEAKASEAKGDERDRLYASQADKYPQFLDYAKGTSRTIPVFVLTRVK